MGLIQDLSFLPELLLLVLDRVESVVEAAGQLTDTVEKVAQGVERVAEEVSDLLPEGGKLRKAVTVVENVSKETVKDAHLAGEVLEKVEEVGKEADSLIETVIQQGSETTKEAKDQL
ncbi:uncharacterized protein LOC8281708 [Ricinus communis]|uniref:uncharacterized protein LOC8281708 n=1 Tax=Ricinus communis TaxID=3988 RepID=UPI00201B33A1|nr:uncharacterized protein LOC8281708 [Ricinus communis]